MGVPFERRGSRTREYVEVMRKLWTERRSSHQGEFVKLTNVLSYPKPVSDNGVPVWFGGEGAAGRAVITLTKGEVGWRAVIRRRLSERRFRALCGYLRAANGDRMVERLTLSNGSHCRTAHTVERLTYR